jgi:hypothetical protein
MKKTCQKEFLSFQINEFHFIKFNNLDQINIITHYSVKRNTIQKQSISLCDLLEGLAQKKINCETV